MRDAAERIRRECKSSVVETLKWKCSLFADFTDPGNAQTSYFALGQRENASRLSIVKGASMADNYVVTD